MKLDKKLNVGIVGRSVGTIIGEGYRNLDSNIHRIKTKKDSKIPVQHPIARDKKAKKNGFTSKKSKFCPSFNCVFLTAVIVTLLSLVVSLILSFSNPKSTHQEGLQTALFYTCSAIWKMGVGVIFGLLGGKKFA